MKFTLIAFNHRHDAIDEEVLKKNLRIEDSRVEIANGVYVFDTQKGWPDIHRLRSLLIYLKLPFVELPFEEGLYGFFPPATCDTLKAIGIKDDALINLFE
jgi:hypothetical protein